VRIGPRHGWLDSGFRGAGQRGRGYSIHTASSPSPGTRRRDVIYLRDAAVWRSCTDRDRRRLRHRRPPVCRYLGVRVVHSWHHVSGRGRGTMPLYNVIEFYVDIEASGSRCTNRAGREDKERWPRLLHQPRHHGKRLLPGLQADCPLRQAAVLVGTTGESSSDTSDTGRRKRELSGSRRVIRPLRAEIDCTRSLRAACVPETLLSLLDLCHAAGERSQAWASVGWRRQRARMQPSPPH